MHWADRERRGGGGEGSRQSQGATGQAEKGQKERVGRREAGRARGQRGQAEQEAKREERGIRGTAADQQGSNLHKGGVNRTANTRENKQRAH